MDFSHPQSSFFLRQDSSLPPGEFGAPNEELGTCDIQVADGNFESGGERNVFVMRFVKPTRFYSEFVDARQRRVRVLRFSAKKARNTSRAELSRGAMVHAEGRGCTAGPATTLNLRL